MMSAASAKVRLDSISRHLLGDGNRPKFELEDHPVDSVRTLRVRIMICARLENMLTCGFLGSRDRGRYLRNYGWCAFTCQSTQSRFDNI